MAQEITKHTAGPLSKHKEGEKVRARDRVFVRWIKNAPGERRDVTGSKAQLHPVQAARLVEKGFVQIISEEEFNTKDEKLKAGAAKKIKAETEV